MSWIDSHCHLDFDVFSDPKSLMTDLEQAGCERVLVPAITAQYFQRVLSFQGTHPNMVDIALGLHPYFLERHAPEHLNQLEQWIQQASPVAIGEIGLDYMLDPNSYDSQLEYFLAQVSIAKNHALPIVVHCRKAHDVLLKHTKQLGFHSGGFIHGFSGSQQQAKKYLDSGFVVGLGGALTYERAKAMKRLVAYLPDDGFVLETDSPDMTPSFANGAINTPLNIPQIAGYIANYRQQSIEDIYRLSCESYHRIMQPS